MSSHMDESAAARREILDCSVQTFKAGPHVRGQLAPDDVLSRPYFTVGLLILARHY
jgi:hypothetical protein